MEEFNMLKRTLISCITILMVFALLLTACGKTEGTVDNSNNNSSSQGSSSTSDTKKETVTIEFFDWFDEEAYMLKIIDAFQAENPNIKVNPTFVPTDEYGQKILVALSGGTVIDVFAVSSPPGYAEYVNKNQLLALDDLVIRDNFDVSGIKDFVEQLKMGGKLYGLPYRKSAWVLFYNKDIFDKYNVPYPDETWTWEKYVEVAQLLTQGEGENKTWGSQNYQPTSTWWRVPANTAGYNNPLDPEHLEGFKKAAKLSYDLSYTYKAQQPYSDRVGTAGGDYAGIFLQGKTAMCFNGDWLVEMLNRNITEKGIKLNYDIAPMPHWEGEESATTGTPTVIMIPKNTKKTDAAFEFIKYVSTEKGAKILAGNGLMPAWNSESVNSIFLENLEQPEHAEYFFAQKIYSQVPTDPLYNSAMEIVKEEVSLYLLDEQGLDETFEKIQQRLDSEISR